MIGINGEMSILVTNLHVGLNVVDEWWPPQHPCWPWKFCPLPRPREWYGRVELEPFFDWDESLEAMKVVDSMGGRGIDTSINASSSHRRRFSNSSNVTRSDRTLINVRNDAYSSGRPLRVINMRLASSMGLLTEANQSASCLIWRRYSTMVKIPFLIEWSYCLNCMMYDLERAENHCFRASQTAWDFRIPTTYIEVLH